MLLRTFASFSMVVACVAVTGCASIINDTNAPVRFETSSATGVEIKEVECKLENDYGQQTVKTPATVAVRRSSKDLQITCVKPGETDGRGIAIARATGGMTRNILLGGSIGAIVDNNNCTACTYPQWVQVVMGKLLTFDRRADTEGQPNTGADLAPVVKAANSDDFSFGCLSPGWISNLMRLATDSCSSGRFNDWVVCIADAVHSEPALGQLLRFQPTQTSGGG